MLKKINIKNFKCLKSLDLSLPALTVLAGPNSSGKSTVIQAILLAFMGFEQENRLALKEVVKPYLSFESVLCYSAEEREVAVELICDDKFVFSLGDKGVSAVETLKEAPWEYEKSLFYLSSGRLGPEEIAIYDEELRIGANGQYAMGWFEIRKKDPIDGALLVKEASAETLKAQMSWWLSFITGVSVDMDTEKVTDSQVVVSFYVDKVKTSPYNVGSGNSYLLKLLIMALTSKPGNLLLIENPEIHLHPAAQSRLGTLLAFLAARGIQLVVETHSEHLIHRVRHEVFRNKLPEGDFSLVYMGDTGNHITLKVNQRGHFCGDDGAERPFPKGFFDVSLKNLLEIG